MAGETATMRVLGPIGDKIVFENELVRVWSVTLDPGQRQPWHQHLLPYLIVPLTEGSNEMTFDDGRVRETHEKPGDAIWREPGIPHELLNRSDWQYRNILIEIKAGAHPEMLQTIRPAG
jgi:quercetin dioxygenase-like cupin family protein